MFKQLLNHFSQLNMGILLATIYASSISQLSSFRKFMDSLLPHICAFMKSIWSNGDNSQPCVFSQLRNIQNVIDFIGHGVILLNNEGEIVAVNRHIEGIWGFSRGELIGKSIQFLLYKNDKDVFEASWSKRNFPPQTFCVKGQRVNKTTFDTEMVLQKPKIGNSDYYMLNIDDISQQVAVETALKEKKMELDMLTYKISHDLRGPLTSILGLVNLVNMENIALQEMKKYVNLIDKSVCKLDVTIKELIFFNEISCRPGIYTHFYASDVIQQSLEEVIMTEENSQDVSFDILMEENIEICSDITLVRNIIYNLIANAVKYKRENVLTKIDILLKKEADFFVVEVSDNGQGIAESIQDKVFNMFYRGNVKSQGSGLGLFLVKQSVEKLHGKIEMESTLNEGTVFRVFLPSEC